MAKTYYVESISNGIETGFVMAVDSMRYYSDEKQYKPIGKAEFERKKKARSLEMLNRYLQKDDTVYSVIRHVASSGISRQIDFYAIGEDRKPVYLSGYIEDVLPYRRNKRGALVVSGCGMDMCFHVVYSLASAMYGDGYALKSEQI